jgi:ABC-type antimicrobial peptide transport system, ATPase component
VIRKATKRIFKYYSVDFKLFTCNFAYPVAKMFIFAKLRLYSQACVLCSSIKVRFQNDLIFSAFYNCPLYNIAMITLRNVNKTYYTEATSLHVLKGIDLNIEQGDYVSIMGASGSGKSTLLNILGILDNYDTGDYYLDNVLIKDLSERQAAAYRNQMIGFVFQSFNLINYKNALENVALPLYYKNVGRKKRNAIAMEYLDRMGLKEWAHHLPNELSGGQKQRVAIARAIISKPKVLLADEPTGALDSTTTEEVMKLIGELNQTGITTLIVTHEKAVSDETRKIIHIKDGLIQDIETKYQGKLK